MQHSISLKKRLLTLLITAGFLLGSVFAAGSETSAATSRLKVSPTKKTIYVGKATTLKANKKVRWSVYKGKKYVKIVSKSKYAKKITIKGLRNGTSYIKAKYGKKIKKVKITVKKKTVSSNVPTKITLAATQNSIGVGDHCSVYVKSVSPSTANKAVTYSSSNEKVATVSRSGLISGVKDGTVTITATSTKNNARKATIKITVLKTLRGTVKLTASLSNEEKCPKGKVARLWIPVPETDANGSQTVSPSSIKYTAKHAIELKITTDSAGNKALYVKWDENADPKDRTVDFSFNVVRREIIRPANMQALEKGTVDKEKMAPYLKETKRSGSLTSGIVKETADKIVKDAHATTVYKKAYAIYDWVCENLRRDNSTPAIGSGDVQYILKNTDKGIGKCTDVNAVFVALCRAEGIPARSVYGLKLNAMIDNPNTPYVQKCKPQYYLPGYGWAEADVSALLKLPDIMGHEDDYRGKNVSAEKAQIWKSLKDEYWGSADEHWMMLSAGGDITLFPKQDETTAADAVLNPDGSVKNYGVLNDDGTLHYFIYPYAEYDGHYLKNYGTTEFDYKYSFEEGNDDCGC